MRGSVPKKRKFHQDVRTAAYFRLARARRAPYIATRQTSVAYARPDFLSDKFGKRLVAELTTGLAGPWLRLSGLPL